MSARAPYFLPYQVAWLNDESRYKIAEKSRRTGYTYVQAYEDAKYAAVVSGTDVWFSSADESAAKEYILYVAGWAEIFGMAAKDLGEIVIDNKNDIKARTVEFASGHRINALSSNPKGFRSKGGKLVLDEFAFHQDQEGMWKAARPIVTWGYPVRVISTYNGNSNRYARMVKDARNGDSNFSLHTTTIERAVREGLADRIMGRDLTDAERQQWLDEERQACGDEETWQQEYMCKPIDSASAFLGWDLITSCEHANAGLPELYEGGHCYVGMDIARRRDLTVIWVVEQLGDTYWTREVISLPKAKFRHQMDAFDQVMSRYRVLRAAIDQTGMGEAIVEELQERHGVYTVEGVLFSGPSKQAIATDVKRLFEDRRVRIPENTQIRDAHQAIRREVTAAGNIRYAADRNEAGHADEFWAHGLALHAAGDSGPPAASGEVDHDQGAYQPDRYRGRLRGRLSA